MSATENAETTKWVAFANDTSGTSNPGCQGTVACLFDVIVELGGTLASRISVNYGVRDFRIESMRGAEGKSNFRVLNSFTPLFGSFTRLFGSGSSPDANGSSLGKQTFLRVVEKLVKRLANPWEGIDILLVNAEGTIHSDSIGAHSLLALCATAKQLGKRVIVTNGSFFGLSGYLLDVLRESSDYLAVREPASFRYLRANGIGATLSADCLFLSHRRKLSAVSGLSQAYSKPFGVYTPGVLSSTNRVPEALVSRDIVRILKAGLLPVYYVVEQEDEKFAAVAADSGAKVIPLGALRWEEVGAFLADAEIVVSGRYHINIFAALRGTPFVPLESNSPKMRGLLEHLGAGDAEIRAWGALGATKRLDLDSAVQIASAEIERCVDLAHRALPDSLSARGKTCPSL